MPSIYSFSIVQGSAICPSEAQYLDFRMPIDLLWLPVE